MATINEETLLEKREEQLQAIYSISNSIREKQQEIVNLQSNLTMNQGALFQLNTLLEDLGVDLESVDKQKSEAEVEVPSEITQQVETEAEISQVEPSVDASSEEEEDDDEFIIQELDDDEL